MNVFAGCYVGLWADISTTFLKYGEWKCNVTLNLNVRAPAKKRVEWQQAVLPDIVQNGANGAVMRVVGQKNVPLYLATLVMYSVCKGGPKNFRNCYKNLFNIFVQVWNFSPLQSTAPVTGCSDPCNARTAGSIV